MCERTSRVGLARRTAEGRLTAWPLGGRARRWSALADQLNMSSLTETNLELALAVLVFLARLGDVGSTYLLTPNLKLETNPLVRRFGWRFAALTLLVAGTPFIPVWGVPCSLVILVASLLITSTNLRSGLFARALGEDRYAEVLEEVVLKTPPWQAYLTSVLSAAVFSMVGLLLIAFYPSPGTSWAWWIAAGLLSYSLAMGLYQPLFLRRAYRRLSQGRSAA